MKSKLTIFLISGLISGLFLTCNGDKTFVFPYVNIDLTIHIPTDMANVGIFDAKIYPSEGVGGVMIFRASDYDFFAFDMACTKEISDSCSVSEYEGSQIIWQCPCCHSQYTLSNNGCYLSKGPAGWPLKQYQAYVDGDFLYVRN